MAFSVYISRTVTIGRGDKIEYPHISTEAADVVYSGERQAAHGTISRMTRGHVCAHYMQPA